MRYLLPLLLVSCGGPGGDVTLAVGGVTMADVEAIRADLSRLKGVSDVKVGAFKDGRAEFKVRYAGDGTALASDLARLGSGLKNVTGFDAASVQVAWDGKAAPPPALPGAPVAGGPPPAPGAPPAVAPPAPTPVKPDEKKEVQVAVEKDPLAYKVHQLPAGTIATFDGWKVQQVPSNDMLILETHPDGKEHDFQMLILVAIQGEQEQSRLFEEGPAKLKQLIPTLQAKSDAQKATFGGDEARVQDWTAQSNGKALDVQSVIIRKKDVAVAVLAFGNAESFKTYGRAVGITAQSISVKDSPPDPAILGTWHFSKYYSSGAGTSNQFSHSSSRSITIYPNGTFTERSMSSSSLNNNSGSTDAYLDGGDRGKVVRRGTTLTFHYDNGKVWNADYKLDGGALMLNGNLWTRQ
jgi:hypothetical protein